MECYNCQESKTCPHDSEVRSNNEELGIEKGQTIQVDEYEIKYKYK